MKYQPKIYEEWLGDSQASVTAVAIRGKEAVIDWLYEGRPSLGKATSKDGVDFSGTSAEIANPSTDRGTFEFRLLAISTGEKLLLGPWHSEIHGDEREFLLLVEPDMESR